MHKSVYSFESVCLPKKKKKKSESVSVWHNDLRLRIKKKSENVCLNNQINDT